MKRILLKYKTGLGWITLTLLLLLGIVLTNVLDHHVMNHFGPRQYVNNLLTFHVDHTTLVGAETRVFEAIPTTEHELETTGFDTLIPLTIVNVEGNTGQKYVKWLAISYFKSKEKYYGYIAEDRQTMSTPKHNLREAENALKLLITDYLRQIDIINQTDDAMQMQMIKNSDEYKIINDNGASIDYAKTSDLKFIRTLTDNVLYQTRYVYFQNGYYEILDQSLRGMALFEHPPVLLP